MKFRSAWSAGFFVALVACSSSGGDGDKGAADAAVKPSSADGATGDKAKVDCTSVACGTVAGAVLRKAETKPSHGGKGDLYIAVFDGNPIVDAKAATLVAQSLVKDVDMTADDAKISFAVPGIPPRAAEYQIVAFLDDDRNASDVSPPGPGKGDLVSMTIDSGSFSGIKVIVSAAGETKVEVQLNAAMP